MLLYPQVYSTVNQNQIHLHLHGTSTEKLEQYLGPDNALMLSNLSQSSSRSATSGGVEVGIGTDNQLGLMTEQEPADGEYKENREDPNNVWRPY